MRHKEKTIGFLFRVSAVIARISFSLLSMSGFERSYPHSSCQNKNTSLYHFPGMFIDLEFPGLIYVTKQYLGTFVTNRTLLDTVE